MIEDILIPEELLQLDKLLSATELIEDSSFLAILGSDSSDLSISLDSYLNQNINPLKKLDLKTNNPLQEIIGLNLTNDFLLLNLFHLTTNETIKNLLFFRDFISDYKLKIIFIIDKTNYLNILKNAIDILETKDNEKYIFIDIYEENNMAIIKIKDNAGGIKEDIIGRVFEPYFTTKHQSQGTGIGLYMSQEIVSRHMNGELIVENITYEFENKTFTGAMFTIKLPFD